LVSSVLNSCEALDLLVNKLKILFKKESISNQAKSEAD